MPTIQQLVDRAQLTLNDTSAAFWTELELLDLVVDGLQEVHAIMKSKGEPDPLSPYWRHFLASGNITLAVGTSEYSLPADYDLFLSLTDTNGEPLASYSIVDEKMLTRGSRLGVQRGQGFYTFVPGGKIRVLVFPGREGVPGEVRNLTLRYFKQMTRHTALGESTIAPEEFCIAAVWYAVGKALIKERESPNEAFGAFQASVGSFR